MRIVTVSSLYPNHKDPKHGVFIETRLKNLLKYVPEVKATVIAPVPWFPFSSPIFGEYSKFSNVMSQENRAGIEVYHPKYLVIPKIGMYLTPLFMKWSILRTLNKLKAQGITFDVIDAHYFFPDGVAVAKVAQKLAIPFTCTARGSDINLLATLPKARKMIERVFKQSAHLMAVCQDLKGQMLKLGADSSKVTVLRNGVDLVLFKPANEAEQQALKNSLGLENKLIISVGRLVELKGHYLIIEAIKNLDNVTLAIAGDGPDRSKLEKLARALDLEDRVIFLGAISQKELNQWFCTADLTVLASSSEGWANVLLESMASGTPVIATDVGGTSEIVAAPAAGGLVARNIKALSAGIKNLLLHPPLREDTRKYAEKFDWSSTSKGQYNIFKRIIKSS